MKPFPHRPTIFAGFAAIHLLSIAIAPASGALSRAVAGSIYLPLGALHNIGAPVYIDNGGWHSPSPLGWLTLTILWAGAWWAITCGIAAFFNDTHSDQ